MSEKLLEVKNLKTYFYTDEGVVKSVDDVSFDVEKGKTLGIVGESGCGKSITSLSIMQLVETPPGKIVGGEIIYQGENLLEKNKGKQIMEALRLHTDLDKEKAKERAIEMLKLVKIPLPEKRFNEYPHQLSGGMRQRVMIAMALSCNPKLLICDEPTTALDVTIQAQILDLINELKEKLGTSVMMITHDLGVIAEVADDVMVMYAGKVVEYGSADDIFESPKHPYTSGLMNCIPKLTDEDHTRLDVIKGMVPSFDQMPKGCAFCPRCSEAKDICRERMPELMDVNGHKVRCFKYSKEWEEA